MGLITAGFILQMVSYRLVEYFVTTTPTAAIPAGTQVVTPLSMRGIYEGALLIVGVGPDIEVVEVTSTTTGTFTATFANTHPATDPIFGATFSSGQPNTPMWSQSEMLGYLADVQNDFLAAVRPVYAIATQGLTVGRAAYPNPADAIRVERISVNGNELWNATQTDIDWQGGYSQRAGQQPQYWYQDKVGPFNFAVDPIPQSGFTARLFYSQSGSTSLGLLDTLTVPDLFWPALVWGVCGFALSRAGEQKDLSRSGYCQRKLTFWEILAGKFLDGLEARFVTPEETVEPMLSQMGK
jgi:hypothetical protein